LGVEVSSVTWLGQLTVGVQIKVTCTSCNKLYIGRTNRNFNTRFKEHRKDFRYTEDKSKFSDQVLREGHEMKTIEETMSIIHLKNNYRKINTLEEIKILKAASSKYLLNDVIAEQNNRMYKLLLSVSDLNSNDQQPRLGNRRNFQHPTRPAEHVVRMMKGL
jgi:GIY-YIG catalytic domain.